MTQPVVPWRRTPVAFAVALLLATSCATTRGGTRTSGAPVDPAVVAEADALVHTADRLVAVPDWAEAADRYAEAARLLQEAGSADGRVCTLWIAAAEAAFAGQLRDVLPELAASAAACVETHPHWLPTPRQRIALHVVCTASGQPAPVALPRGAAALEQLVAVRSP